MNQPIAQPFLPATSRNPQVLARQALNVRIQTKTWADQVTAQINSQTQGVGDPIASSLNITVGLKGHPIYHVTGTAKIKTITPPSNFTGPIWLIADGLWQTITGGNIKEAIIVTVGRAYQWVFDGALWYLVM